MVGPVHVVVVGLLCVVFAFFFGGGEGRRWFCLVLWYQHSQIFVRNASIIRQSHLSGTAGAVYRSVGGERLASVEVKVSDTC